MRASPPRPRLMSAFPSLFEPLRIGTLTVRNRIVQPAHAKLYSQHSADTQRDLKYHVARARGGCGLLITGERLVHPTSSTGRSRFTYACLASTVEADRKITTAVHNHGAAIFAQLNHKGVEGGSDSPDDLRVLYAPSAVSSPASGESPKAMEYEEIADVVSSWATSAEHSREGGFDGAELHLAHGYLLQEFLSPLYNHREDEYGGSLENRLRLTREVITAIRERVGRDWPLGVRLGLTEFAAGGIEIDDAIKAERLLCADGLIDFINTSGGGYFSGPHRLIAPSDIEDGWLIDRVARIKKSVDGVPVFAVGAVRDPRAAEQVVASGAADMVGMARALIADPDLPNKLRDGRGHEVRRCIKSNQGCISRVFRGLPMSCTVNPAAGREGLFEDHALTQASVKARYAVVGGGPAGMKAAETLARRGHSVTLIEQAPTLGGQINLLVRAPFRESFGDLVEDLTGSLDRLDVEVRCSTRATPDLLGELEFERLLIATGAAPERDGFSVASPTVRTLPGASLASVVSSWDVLQGTAKPEGTIVVLDSEGTREAAGVCEVLLDRGHSVELVTRWNSLFPFTAHTLDQPLLYQRLLSKALRYRLGYWATAVTPSSVRLRNLYTGALEELRNVDGVVLVTGRRADDALYWQLKAAGADVQRIGDCLAPRTLDHAIYEGYVAGQEIVGGDRYIPEGRLDAALA